MTVRTRRASRRRRRHSSDQRPFFDKSGGMAFFADVHPPDAIVQKSSFLKPIQGSAQNSAHGVRRKFEDKQTPPIRRQPDVATRFEPLPLPSSVVDAIIRQAITSELRRFQRIPILVADWHTTRVGSVSVPYPRMYLLRVKAAYFINTAKARAHFGAKNRRGHRDFRKVMSAVEKQGQMSRMPNYKGKPRSVARTVQLGKGTPDDIRRFIQTAVSQSAVRSFARRKKKLAKGQQLTDLSRADVQQVVQEWVYHHGIGIDCSGLVLQAAIRAREKVREAATGINEWLGGTVFGVPPEIDPTERGAASFKARKHRGAKVAKPIDLRPGDAWVVSGGDHIRIVTDVRTITRPDGTEAVEFDTAESSGGSTQVMVGPVEKTWQTAARERFGSIKLIKGVKGGSVKGPFYRIP